MAQPEDLLYSKEHEWVKLDGDSATIGITDYAQNALGDIVYVELPKVGAAIEQFAPVGVIESVKAVSDLFTPLSGEVARDQRRARERSGRRQPRSVRRRLAAQDPRRRSERGQDAAAARGIRQDRHGVAPVYAPHTERDIRACCRRSASSRSTISCAFPTRLR